MFGFAMNYYQMNLVFALVGWFCTRTLATNSILAGWFKRLMIELNWRNDCFIRSRGRRRREPSEKIEQKQQQSKKKRFRFGRVAYLFIFTLILSSLALALETVITCGVLRNARESVVKRASFVLSTRRKAVEVMFIGQMQRRNNNYAIKMSETESGLDNIDPFLAISYVIDRDAKATKDTSIVQLGGWHNNESSLSNDNGFMTIDNQPRLAMQRTTHTTRQSNHLSDATLSTISIYDDIRDETLDLGVGDGARGPSLCNDLQQKQSFESLDNVKGNQNNDATSSKVSHF